jgi:hypothetical protein
MKSRIQDLITRIANDLFPRQVHCAFCLTALANFDGSQRFCPHCKFPLY